ncbi:MAG TPA: hypothetical protein VGF61_00785 [Candidatus Acidoferrum sp.]|jgi:hypothetical protein
MSTDPQKHGDAEMRVPVHDDVSYEPQDVRVTSILKFLIYLGIGTVLSFVIALFVYHTLTSYFADNYTPPPPSRADQGPTMPPEPRLQGMPGHMMDPQQEWRDTVKAANAANNELNWIDEKSGIAQIPVKDAMQLIVQKGLPGVPAMPAEKK